VLVLVLVAAAAVDVLGAGLEVGLEAGLGVDPAAALSDFGLARLSVR
jgi:hypothetical protein